MKSKKTTRVLFAVIIFGLFSIGKTTGQTAAQAQAAYDKEHANDAKYLAGFDEQAVIAELTKKGIPASEFKGIIKGKKSLYIAEKKGTKSPSPYFPKFIPFASRDQSGCPNAGFEDTTFTNWTGGIGDCSNYPSPTVWTLGIFSGAINAPVGSTNDHHTLMTSAGYDPNVGGTLLPLLAPGGGNVSCRLGNSDINAGTEFLSYLIHVTPINTSFTYQYAVVLEDPGHSADEQPRFNISVTDSVGNPVSGPCGAYDVNASDAGNDPTFQPFSGGYYKNWTTVTIDLTGYPNQTLTIRFVTQDCTLGGHYGYAYIDASCSQLQAQVAFCPTDTIVTLTAPVGFTGYQWYTGTPLTAIPGATSATYIVHSPVLNQQYNVVMTSVTGCGSSLTAILVHSNMQLLESSRDVSCNSLSNGYIGVVQSGGNGPFTFHWTNSAGTLNQTHNNGWGSDSLLNLPPGDYYVTAQTPGGCFAADTIHITEPPALPVNHIGTPFCPHDAGVTLTAPTGSTYQWYGPSTNNSQGPLIQGATSSTYVVTSPVAGQGYTVNYLPPSGCANGVRDSLYLYHLNQPPYGVTNVTCYGYSNGSATVSQPNSVPSGAPGPYTYSWSNPTLNYTGAGSTVSNLFAGTYYVTATSGGGCTSTDTVLVNQQPSGFDSLALTTTYCPGDDPITLHAPHGYASYTWYQSPTASGSPIPFNDYDSLIVYNPIPGVPYTVVMPNPTSGNCNIVLNFTLEYQLPPPPPNFITSTNIFTPNGDGINDKFLLNQNTYGYIKEFHLEVYNRWGKKVYESSQLSDQWDGKINGNTADEGVYYWMASYTQACLDNAPTITANGFVQIIR